MSNRLKKILTGALIGIIGGPVIGGVLGFLLISITWLVQNVIWPSTPQSGILSWAGVFAVLVAPVGASVGVMVGVILGSLSRLFGKLANAGSFGGVLGAVTGLIVGRGLFGGQGGDLTAFVVAVFTLALTGLAVGLVVRYQQLRRAKPS